MSWLGRVRIYALNAFIAAIVALVVIDTLPQSPNAVRAKLTPLLIRLGIKQGVWNLFAPDPDRMNNRWRAEITYRDGEKREWKGPDWSQTPDFEQWVRHRHVEWHDHVATQQPAWESWCRYLARSQRPDLPDADRGAEVKVIFHEALNPPAETRPWRSFRERAKFDDGWVMIIEKLE